jgi:hypothetical protein
MRGDIQHPSVSDQPVPAGNPLLSFHVAPDLKAAIQADGLSEVSARWQRIIDSVPDFVTS